MFKYILIILLMFSSLGYGKAFSSSKFKSIMKKHNWSKVTQVVKKSPHTQKILTAPIKVDTPISPIEKVALSISNKSGFADKLMAHTKRPADLIREYGKHGDALLETMEMVNTKVLKKHSFDELKKSFPSMPKITLHQSEELNDKFLETLKYTGSKGWEALQKLGDLAKKHPKSTLVAGAIAWYVIDPDSFFEQKEKLINFVSGVVEEGASDITQVTLQASSGVANGVTEVVKEKMTWGSMIVLGLLMISVILWKLRRYISRYIHIKLENRLQKEEKRGLL